MRKIKYLDEYATAGFVGLDLVGVIPFCQQVVSNDANHVCAECFLNKKKQ